MKPREMRPSMRRSNPFRGFNHSDEEYEDRSFNCKICGYKWIPRGDNAPIKCPSCRSIRWNSDNILFYDCKHCGHRWASEKESPIKCPKCQSTKWMDQLINCECLRCGHKWNSRGGGESTMCPSCKSRFWNIPIHYWTCSDCGKKVMIKNNTRFGLCPDCDKNRRINECIKCNNVWKSSRRIIPKICPKCKSHDWHKEMIQTEP